MRRFVDGQLRGVPLYLKAERPVTVINASVASGGINGDGREVILFIDGDGERQRGVVIVICQTLETRSFFWWQGRLWMLLEKGIFLGAMGADLLGGVHKVFPQS